MRAYTRCVILLSLIAEGQAGLDDRAAAYDHLCSAYSKRCAAESESAATHQQSRAPKITEYAAGHACGCKGDYWTGMIQWVPLSGRYEVGHGMARLGRSPYFIQLIS